mgnify:CR=1
MGVISENSSCSQALDGADADDVSEAGGAQQGSVSHATKESGIGELSAFVGMLD